MSFNYAAERNKFESSWSTLRKEYVAAGMSQQAIEAMYQFDLQEFNAERAYRNRNFPLDLTYDQADVEDAYEMPLLQGHLEKHTAQYDTYGAHSRYWWLEEIESPKLQAALVKLTDADKNLLTLYFVEGYTQAECADILHISQCALHKRLARIFAIFAK